MTYHRRLSPLHAARTPVAAAWCGSLAVAALVLDHPLALVATLLAVVGGAVGAGLGRELWRVGRIAAPLALLVALVNPLVTRNGLTVIARVGELPVLGRVDITLEATVYGLLLGLRVLIVALAFSLYSAAVDPDEMLRLLRRVSLRSALTAALATRLVPVLARDGRRLADAQRCRPGVPAPRITVMRAVAANALDRAVDMAAALELRGYGRAVRPPRLRRPWSRHDIAFAASGVAVVALVIAAGAWGIASFHAYPRLHMALGVGDVLLPVAIVVCALLPFLDRRDLG